MKPEQIKPGKKYRLSASFSKVSIVRKVEEIRGDNVVVLVNGREVEMPVKDFASLAVAEVE